MKTYKLTHIISIILCSATLMHGATNEELEKRVAELEKIVSSLKEANIEDQLSELGKIVSKSEKKTLSDKINWAPEIRLRMDKFDYKNKYIQGENTTKADGITQFRDEFEKHYEPALAARFRLNINSDISDDARFFGRVSIDRSSQSSQRICILSDTILSASPKTSLEIDRAYADYYVSPNDSFPLIFSFGLLPTSGGSSSNLAENTPRKSVFPSLAFDMNSYGVIATTDLSKSFANGTFLRFVAAKAYTKNNDSFYYQCNREIFLNGDLYGIFAETSVPYFGHNLVQFGINRTANIKAIPYLGPLIEANTAVTNNLGSIDNVAIGWEQYGLFNSKATFFVNTAMSVPHGNGKQDSYRGTQADVNAKTAFTIADGYANGTLLTENGYAIHAGMIYQASQKAKLGFEYNQGNKYWWAATQGSEDVFNKLATRGKVGEAYLIWSYTKNIFSKLGYLYSKEEFTGSGWHFGEPAKKSSVQTNGYLILNASF